MAALAPIKDFLVSYPKIWFNQFMNWKLSWLSLDLIWAGCTLGPNNSACMFHLTRAKDKRTQKLAFALLTQWPQVPIPARLQRFFSTAEFVNSRDWTHLMLMLRISQMECSELSTRKKFLSGRDVNGGPSNSSCIDHLTTLPGLRRKGPKLSALQPHSSASLVFGWFGIALSEVTPLHSWQFTS